MSDRRTTPKFRIGDLVAVYAQNNQKKIVIPKTQVLDRVWIPRGSEIEVDGKEGIQSRSGWFCELDATPYIIYEGCLRPWRPDDYVDEEELEELDLTA